MSIRFRGESDEATATITAKIIKRDIEEKPRSLGQERAKFEKSVDHDFPCLGLPFSFSVLVDTSQPCR